MVKEINKINERELDLDTKGSWHDDYKGMLARLTVFKDGALKLVVQIPRTSSPED